MKYKLLKRGIVVLLIICSLFIFLSTGKAARKEQNSKDDSLKLLNYWIGYSTGISNDLNVSFVDSNEHLTYKLYLYQTGNTCVAKDGSSVNCLPITIDIGNNRFYNYVYESSDGLYVFNQHEDDGGKIMQYYNNNKKYPEILMYKRYSSDNKFNLYNDYNFSYNDKKTTIQGSSGQDIGVKSKLIFFNSEEHTSKLKFDTSFDSLLKHAQVNSEKELSITYAFINCSKKADDGLDCPSDLENGQTMYYYSEGLYMSYYAGIDLWKKKIKSGLTEDERKVFAKWFDSIIYIPFSEFFDYSKNKTVLDGLVKKIDADVMKQYNDLKYDENKQITWILSHITLSDFEKYNLFKLFKASTNEESYHAFVADAAISIYNKANDKSTDINKIKADATTYFTNQTNLVERTLFEKYCSDNSSSTTEKNACITNCQSKLDKQYTGFSTCKNNAINSYKNIVSDSSVDMIASADYSFKSCLNQSIEAAKSITGGDVCPISTDAATAASELIENNDYRNMVDEQKNMENAKKYADSTLSKKVSEFKASIEAKKVEVEIECETVKEIRWLWLLIIFSAPFLLILFGSIDYFKVMIASDMDGMNKFKKNFRTRVIAFLLLILTPFIIRTIVGFVGADSDSKPVKLMYCIVVGGD